MNEKHQELLALYQKTSNDINNHKTLPWKVNIANAVLIGFVTSIIMDIKFSCYFSRFFPFLFPIFVSCLTFTFFSCYIAGVSFDRLRAKRIILSKIHCKFSDQFAEVNDCSISGKNIKQKTTNNMEFGDFITLFTSIAFPIFLLISLLILCVL